MVNDSVCRAVIKAGLATSSPGGAEAWCNVQGKVVRADFERANIRLTSGDLAAARLQLRRSRLHRAL